MSKSRIGLHQGVAHAVPWPIPLAPGQAALSFWGFGDQTTQPFVLYGDAVLRIVIERGLLLLRVRCPDGSEIGNQTTMAGPGLAIDDIPLGGTFTLEVRASARWGITVVYTAGYTEGLTPTREDDEKLL